MSTGPSLEAFGAILPRARKVFAILDEPRTSGTSETTIPARMTFSSGRLAAPSEEESGASRSEMPEPFRAARTGRIHLNVDRSEVEQSGRHLMLSRHNRSASDRLLTFVLS